MPRKKSNKKVKKGKKSKYKSKSRFNKNSKFNKRLKDDMLGHDRDVLNALQSVFAPFTKKYVKIPKGKYSKYISFPKIKLGFI